MSDSQSLIGVNISLLIQGIDLLERISNEQYTFTEPNLFQSGVGKHMRHILDHYESLVNGWSNKIDYDARIRNTEVETSTAKAAEKCKLLVHSLKKFEHSDHSINLSVLVKSNEGGKSRNSPWSSSSIKRELQFMVSHTIHHYALIAFILRSQGIEVSSDFGVAPSTLHHQNKESMQH